MAREGKRKIVIKPEEDGEESDPGHEEEPATNWKQLIEDEVKQTLPGVLRLCISNAKKQRHDLLKHTIEGVTATQNVAALVKEYAEEHLATLESITKEYASIHGQIGQYDSKLTNLERAVQSSRIPDSFDGTLDTSSYAPTDDQLSKHDFVTKFYAAAGIEREGEEDEEVMLQETNSVRNMSCPITQMLMEEPMRNPACGHTYSRKGIDAHMKLKSSCPVAGCPHKVANLERDVEMEVLLSRYARRGNSSQYVGASNVDSEDEEEVEHVVE
ncbi:unnamed protein product [Aphanomyces euteiches]|uniref:SP-RING-type domain-containing protein n=1 Tax=Aphanomyces euteiches TaxID=100861 RepID=A0A6G0WGH2_9STRA|nr:hypothetical protein Ae201684_015458 [Aphanomyces euteiches]KAH9097779.1 hypothetical protein Ae201684P_001255 [Aphanomyces euteiches]KAH9143480.1 hypothetical protein AeRB84_012521 [Aphanomyces euteiches]